MKEVTAVSIGEQITPIDDISIERPNRHGVGKGIQTLAASMAIEGMRHPVLIMPSGDLLDGRRRLAAARQLGWTTIPAKQVFTVEDATEAIKEADDEHTVTRTIEEWVDLGLMIETLDHRDIGKHADYVQNVIGPAVCPKGTGSMYKRGRAVVLASRSHIRPRHVVEAAQNAIRAVDAGTMTINAAYTRIRVATRSDPPVEGAVGDELPAIPPPSPEARSPKARQLRIAWIRALAAKGATTNQIAEKIGIGASAIRRIYKDCGIVNVADAALNRAPVKAVDPNRAMRVILDDLDALVWSLDGIEIDGLDRNETGEWAKALAQYARAIGRVSRKVKGAS